MPHSFNSVVLESEEGCEFTLDLDCRESYDVREFGRFYEVYGEPGSLVIRFTKKTDSREDKTNDVEEYKLFVSVKFEGSIEKIDQWKKVYYEYDCERGSAPFERFVFSAVKVHAKKLVISVSDDEVKAKDEANYIFRHSDFLKTRQKEHYEKIFSMDLFKKVREPRTKMALRCAIASLDGLCIEEEDACGIYAGLPWFFQFWGRDEAICLRALSFFNLALAKKILLRHANSIMEDGRTPNIFSGHYTESPKTSADAVGWAFKRAETLLDEGKLYEREIAEVKSNAELSLNRMMPYFKNNLICNDDLETWMDTTPDGNLDKREGFRIEIQALQLSIYSLLNKITKSRIYSDLKEKLIRQVREKFWNGRILADGLNDATIRPNAFIAAYACPELLVKEEWEICIDNMLEHLWNSWGGFSTIDKSSPLFKDTYSGENPISYHRGDSWFWINNLAALIMHRVNRKGFKKQIYRILDASTNDILFAGIIGHHSELSGSRALKAEGSQCQAWSSAMYIELVGEIYGG